MSVQFPPTGAILPWLEWQHRAAIPTCCRMVSVRRGYHWKSWLPPGRLFRQHCFLWALRLLSAEHGLYYTAQMQAASFSVLLLRFRSQNIPYRAGDGMQSRKVHKAMRYVQWQLTWNEWKFTENQIWMILDVEIDPVNSLERAMYTV